MVEAKILAMVIEALCLVESGGRPDAVNGECVGILQITPIMVEDLNRIAGREKWQLADRLNPAKSKCMAMEYMIEYAEDWMGVHGLALLWKCGPAGMWRQTKLADQDYADRVENLVKEMGKP